MDEKKAFSKAVKKRFFDRWRKLTLGRVTVQKASDHYEKTLQEKCLRRWENKHVFSRREWKLTIRADYHYRFNTWQKVLDGWRIFVKLQREESKKNSIAKQHAERNHLKHSLESWKNFVKEKKKKRRKDVYAQAKYKQVILRKHWRLLLLAYNNKCTEKNMEIIALHHWADKLKSKTLEKWKYAYLDLCDEKKQLHLADIFYMSRLARKCLQSFKCYLHIRRHKNQINQRAISQYNTRLSQHYLSCWHKELLRLQREQQHHNMLVEKGHQAVKRRCLTRLKQYSNSKNEERKKLIIAEDWNQKMKKKKYLNRWKSYVDNRNAEKDRYRESLHFYTKKVLWRSFNKWLSRCDHREEMKLYPLSKVASNYYKSRICSTHLYKWLRYVKDRRRKQQLTELAHQHFNRKLVPRYVEKWILFVRHQTKWHDMNVQANEYRCTLLYSKFFYTWTKFHSLHIQYTSLVDLAYYQSKRMVMLTHFRKWNKRTEQIRLTNCLEVLAGSHSKTSLLRRHFKRWKFGYQEIVKCESNWNEACAYHETFLKRTTLHSFKKYHESCRGKRELINKARKFYTRKQTLASLNALKRYAIEERTKNILAERIYREKAFVLLRWTLNNWKEFVSVSKTEHEKNCQAEDHRNRHMNTKVFKAIRMFAVKRSEKRFSEENTVFRAQVYLEKNVRRRLFIKWRRLTVEVKTHANSNQIARVHYERELKTTVIRALRCMVYLSYQNKVLQVKGGDFCRESLLTRHFDVWVEMFDQRKVMQRKNRLALVWWCRNLQRKVLSGWIVYTKEKRERRQEYSNALQLRKQLLVQEGLVNWIKFATDQQSRRREIANQQQMERNLNVQARVHRYAMKWYYKTKRNAHSDHISTRAPQDVYMGMQDPIMSSPLPNIRKRAAAIILPPSRTRPSPRIPDYLRESFDLTKLSKDNNSLQHCGDITQPSNNSLQHDHKPANKPRLLRPSEFAG